MYLRESFHHLYKKTCWAKTWPIINRRINVLQPQAFVVHSWTDGGTNTLDRCLHVSLSPEHDCGDVFQGNLFVCEVQPPLLFLSTWSGSSKGKKNVSSIRGFTAALTQQPHSLRHNRHDNNDDGCYGDRVRGQAGEKHICREEEEEEVEGRTGGCLSVATMWKLLRAARALWHRYPSPGGRQGKVCLLLLKGSGSRIQARGQRVSYMS